MAISVATMTVNDRIILRFQWSQVQILKKLLFFFHLSHVLFFFSSILLLLICISENENIGIVSISFIVIHT